MAVWVGWQARKKDSLGDEINETKTDSHFYK